MIEFLNTNIPDPVAFSVFGMEIMWYGILIGFAILVSGTIFCRRAPKRGIAPERTLDALLISLPAGIIGARIYYVAFNWEAYSGDFLRIVNLRLGGLAIHGGLIAAFLAAFVFCRVKRLKPLDLFDLAAPCIALAQSIGRWGNYFNSEAHGGPTALPWGIPVGGQMVHPTFLYESIWCFILFLILIIIDNRRAFEGQVFLLYGTLYSLERFFVESLRTDSLMLGAFKQARVLSAAVFFICLACMVFLWRRRVLYETRYRRTA